MNLAAVKSPAAVSCAKSMIWLFQFLTLVSCLGPGNAVTQTTATPLLVVNGVLGETVTLPLKFPGGQETNVIWLHDKTAIIIIQPEAAQIQVIDPKRKDRLRVSQFYSLQINNLTMADSGCYYAQISTENSIEISKYNLGIFRRLRNLQVTNHTELSDNGTCEIHLICSVENPNDHVSFRWQVTGNTPLEEANLTISWNPKNSSEQTYTCTAMNPVSNLSFSLSAQSLCKGAFHKKNQHPNIIWIIIVVSFICITVCPMFFWRKRITGFLSSYLFLLQGFRQLECGVPFTCLFWKTGKEREDVNTGSASPLRQHLEYDHAPANFLTKVSYLLGNVGPSLRACLPFPFWSPSIISSGETHMGVEA